MWFWTRSLVTSYEPFCVQRSPPHIVVLYVLTFESKASSPCSGIRITQFLCYVVGIDDRPFLEHQVTSLERTGIIKIMALYYKRQIPRFILNAMKIWNWTTLLDQGFFAVVMTELFHTTIIISSQSLVFLILSFGISLNDSYIMSLLINAPV